MKSKKLPRWLKKELPRGEALFRVKDTLRTLKLNTVCRSAKCPNIGECFSAGTATFMIMGTTCTRDCRFCAVSTGIPDPIDSEEPGRVAEAARILGLKYVVITSVTRDDLKDGGAGHFSETVKAVRKSLPDSRVEVLIPDFKGDHNAVGEVIASRPSVFNHNVETVSRVYPLIRPFADYHRSLMVLKSAKKCNGSIITKSGLMLGLGETVEEVLFTMEDLRDVGCDLLTLGQYINPSDHHFPVKRFLHPDEFHEFRSRGEKMGFLQVASGPFVRSSYHAGTFAENVLNPREKG